MKRAQKTITLLSPLAFALTLGAYAESSPPPLDAALVWTEAALVAQDGSTGSDDLDWVIDWIERHGTA